MSLLAVVPARGGSKAIPDKNIALVGGKPLIAWTILAARESRNIDRLIVSTDSPKIARVAEEYGAEIPFLRPAELAKDHTPGIAPVIHAVDCLSNHENYQPDEVIYLQPTSPLRTASDIDQAVGLLRERGADAVLSVVQPEHHPYWMRSTTPDGWLQLFLPDKARFTRRQDLPQALALNGAIYLIKRAVLMEIQSFHPEKTWPYIMPPERSLDIDTPWDLFLADLILSNREQT